MAFYKSFFSAVPPLHPFELCLRSKDVWNYPKLIIGKRFFKTKVLQARCRNHHISMSRKEAAPIHASLAALNLGNRELSLKMLWKPFVFTLSFSAGSMVGCAIWQYENMRRDGIYFKREPNFWYKDRYFWNQQKRYSWRDDLNKMWNKLSEAEKLFIPICFANLLVFAAWRVPRFQPAMISYFSSNPNSHAICWPLILSTFSHFSFIHLALNMYALNSFSKNGVQCLGKEQFLALYLAGGVISSFTSLFFRVARKKPGLSVGASGAIMTIVGYLCAKFPNMELSIIGLPWWTFTAGNAIKVLITFDLTGLILGWKFLDHAAHLGGALSGICWFYWGNSYIWQKREPLLQWWHKMRDGVK